MTRRGSRPIDASPAPCATLSLSTPRAWAAGAATCALLGALTGVLAGALTLGSCGGGGASGDPGGGGGGGGGLSAPSGLSYSGASYLTRLGETFASPAPDVLGEELTYSVEPALPQGLVLDADDGRLLGSPALRSHRQQYTIKASNAAGETSALVELSVVGPTRFAYVANAGDGTISICVVDAESGKLRPQGFHAQDSANGQPEALVAHPDGNVLYSANQGLGELVRHTLDPNTGRVMSNASLPIDPGPHALAIRPDGRFLYVLASGGNSLATFAVAPGTGALTPVGSPASVGGAASSLLVDPLGRYLAVGQPAAGTITTFRIDPTNGIPTLVGTSAVSLGAPEELALAPDGRNLYATVRSANRLVQFAVDPTSSALTELGSQPTGAGPGPLMVHPLGAHAYVLNIDAGSLSRFALDASGAPTLLATSSAPTGADWLAFDAGGEFAYALDRDACDLIWLDYQEATGALEELDRTRTRSQPAALALASGVAPAHPRATHLYVANRGSDSVTSFRINASNGHLLDPLEVATGTAPTDVVLDPWGRFAFVANSSSGSISRFSIQANGTLASLGAATPVGGTPTALFVESSGRFLFVTDMATDTVIVLSVAEDGTLTQLTSSAVGTDPIDVESSPNGEFLYVVNQGGGLTELRLDPRSGVLASIGTALTNGSPRKIEFSNGGLHAYGVMPGANFILPYRVDADTGELVFVPPGSRPDTTPVDVDLSASGRFAFTAQGNPASIGSVMAWDVAPDGGLWNAGTGTHTWTYSANPGVEATALESDPDERFLFVLNQPISVAVLTIDPTTGALAPVQEFLTGITPTAMALGIRIE